MLHTLRWTESDEGRKFWASTLFMPLFLLLIGATSQLQSLRFGAIPSVSTYQLGKSLAVSDIASLSDSSGTVKVSTPYSLSNTSQQQRILVKVASDLPSTLGITVSIDQPTGITSDGPVRADGTDRSLVSTLQRGSYTGQLHYAIEGTLPQQANGAINVIYTLNAS